MTSARGFAAPRLSFIKIQHNNFMNYTSSYGTMIPSSAMATVCNRIAAGEDWQKIETEELRRYIPEHADDLDEASEVMNEAQERVADAEVEAADRKYQAGYAHACGYVD